MKRRMLALLLAVPMLAMLTAAAFAEDTDLGVFNVRGPLTVMSGTQDGNFYTFELNCTRPDRRVFARAAPRGRQQSPHRRQHPVHRPDERGGRQGDIHPQAKALTEGTYNVYISTTDKPLEKVASFEYGTKPPYTLGDVDGLNGIDSTDALMVLQHIVGIRTLTGTQLLAADVDGVDGVTSTDALMILQYIVGSIKSFR